MATSVGIQVKNGKVTITIGRPGGGKRTKASGGNGEMSDTGGGKAGAGCCGPLVIGPIVVGGCGAGSSSGQQGGDGEMSDTGGNGEMSDTGGDGEMSDTGGGNAGSGCCCPTVIGPIVIGCCGNPATSPAQTAPPAVVAIDPPGSASSPSITQLSITSRMLGLFQMQIQEEKFWCWAAVAVSVSNFLDPRNPPTWTQSTLAAKVLGIVCSPQPDPNDPCDHRSNLDGPLSRTGNLSIKPPGTNLNTILPFTSIQNWVAAQLPVCARILWNNGNGHFIALTGSRVFSSGEQQVYVQDPSPQDYGSAFIDYATLVSDYMGQGSWHDTYLVQP